jgi:hypothetical protein
MILKSVEAPTTAITAIVEIEPVLCRIGIDGDGNGGSR